MESLEMFREAGLEVANAGESVEDTALAILVLAETVNDLITAINKLGLNGADSNLGALEFLAREVKEGTERVAGAVVDSSTKF